MYSLAIYFYMLCVNIAALCGNKKAQQMMRGHRNTWRILREQINGAHYVWFHAASLGEFEQGRPLMERLRREQPNKKILLTFFSPSGYEVRKDYAGADVICYLPFDTPFNARKFIRLARPESAFFIKYEFWRNYIDALSRRNIPVFSVSSIFRPKQIFFRGYGFSYRRVLKRFTHLFVQDAKSEQLLKTIGVHRVSVVGDTRFARVVDIMHEAKSLPIAEAFAQGRKVIVAGSTWAPDEALLTNYFNAHPDTFLILAPHVVNEAHLQEIEARLQRPSLRYTQTTTEAAPTADCLIIDCYRLLASIYRYAAVAYVGGGFGVGIHNVPEAAVYGLPVLIGPNNGKFREARELLAAGGCREVRTQTDVDRTLDELLHDDEARRKAGEISGAYIRENAGAADKVYQAALLPESH